MLSTVNSYKLLLWFTKYQIMKYFSTMLYQNIVSQNSEITKLSKELSHRNLDVWINVTDLW